MQHFITLSEVMDHMTAMTHCVSILPPAARDQGSILSDKEDLGEEETEPVGKIELENEDNDKEDNCEEHLDTCWHKHSTFQHNFGPTMPIPSMEEQYPVLATKTEFELWKGV